MDYQQDDTRRVWVPAVIVSGILSFAFLLALFHSKTGGEVAQALGNVLGGASGAFGAGAAVWLTFRWERERERQRAIHLNHEIVGEAMNVIADVLRVEASIGHLRAEVAAAPGHRLRMGQVGYMLDIRRPVISPLSQVIWPTEVSVGYGRNLLPTLYEHVEAYERERRKILPLGGGRLDSIVIDLRSVERFAEALAPALDMCRDVARLLLPYGDEDLDVFAYLLNMVDTRYVWERWQDADGNDLQYVPRPPPDLP